MSLLLSLVFLFHQMANGTMLEHFHILNSSPHRKRISRHVLVRASTIHSRLQNTKGRSLAPQLESSTMLDHLLGNKLVPQSQLVIISNNKDVLYQTPDYSQCEIKTVVLLIPTRKNRKEEKKKRRGGLKYLFNDLKKRTALQVLLKGETESCRTNGKV